jgi:hypothetical protein
LEAKSFYSGGRGERKGVKWVGFSKNRGEERSNSFLNFKVNFLTFLIKIDLKTKGK